MEVASNMMHSHQELQRLCQAALHSLDEQERLNSQNELRYLCQPEMWGHLQVVMKHSTDEAVLFMCNKALMFIVSNEIGPGERDEVQTFILTFVEERANAGQPLYLTKSMLSVYAMALYLNWRMMVISLEEESLGSVIGKRIYEKISAHLSYRWRILAMTEVLSWFTREDEKTNLMTVREAFASRVLPYFFQYAVQMMKSAPSLQDAFAPELHAFVSQCLDFVPPTSVRPIVTTRITSEETLFIAPLEEWYAPTLDALHVCCGCAHEREIVLPAIQLARQLATLDFTRATDREQFAFVSLLVNFVCITLMKFQAMIDMSELLSADALDEAVRCLCNIYERYPSGVTEILAADPHVISILTSFAHRTAERWDESEEEVRNSLMWFLSLLVEHYCENPNYVNVRTGEDLRQSHIQSLVHQTCTVFLEQLVAKCQLSEGGPALHTEEGLVMHSEKLRPMVRLIVQQINTLGPQLSNLVKTCCTNYEWCLQLGSGRPVPPEMHSWLESISSDNKTHSTMAAANGAMSPSSRAKFWTKIVLTRLATVFHVIAITLKDRTAHSIFVEDAMSDDSLLGKCISFVQSFLTDDLSDALMTSMNFSDDPQQSRSSDSEENCHVGILRVILFLCEQLRMTVFSGKKSVNSMTLLSIRYVLQKYSHIPVLGLSAANLLLTTLASPDLPSEVLVDPVMDSIVEMVTGDRCEIAVMAYSSSVLANCREDHFRIRKRIVAALSSLAQLRLEIPGLSHSRHRTMEQVLKSRFSYLHSPIAEAALTDFSLWRATMYAMMADYRGLMKCLKDPKLISQVLASFVEVHTRFCQFAQFSSDVPDGVKRVHIEVLRTFAKWSVACLHHLPDCESTPMESGTAFAQFVLSLCQSIFWQYPGGLPSRALCEVGKVVWAVFRGGWCNVGVMNYYGDHVAETVLNEAVRSLLRYGHDVTEIMALKKERNFLFRGIASAQGFRFPSRSLRDRLNAPEVVDGTAHCLLRCLQDTPLLAIIECLHAVIMLPSTRGKISDDTLRGIFKEICVLVGTSTNPMHSLAPCCEMMLRCHQMDPHGMEAELEGLLDIASAYHRVRLRCLLMLLRNPPAGDLAKSFGNVFSVNARSTATLTAW